MNTPTLYSNPIVIVVGIILFLFTIQSKRGVCEKSLKGSFTRQLHHGGLGHFYFNMAAFANLTYYIQSKVGWSTYLLIVFTIMALITFADYVLYGADITHCSIGFSGVVFGLLGWSLFNQRGFSQSLIMDLVLLLLPSLWIRQISFSGHLIGLLAGIGVYYYGFA